MLGVNPIFLDRIVCTHGAIVALCNASFGHIGRHRYCDTSKKWFVCGADNIWNATSGVSDTCLPLEREMQDNLRLALSWMYQQHADYSLIKLKTQKNAYGHFEHVD